MYVSRGMYISWYLAVISMLCKDGRQTKLVLIKNWRKGKFHQVIFCFDLIGELEVTG